MFSGFFKSIAGKIAGFAIAQWLGGPLGQILGSIASRIVNSAMSGGGFGLNSFTGGFSDGIMSSFTQAVTGGQSPPGASGDESEGVRYASAATGSASDAGGAAGDLRIEFIQFDKRTENILTGLHPDVAATAREQLIRMSEDDLGVDVKLYEGYRTLQTQEGYFNAGSSNVKVGYHNVGAAYDIQLFEPDGRYIQNGSDIAYQQAGRIGKELGLTWGGDWKNLIDAGHFQLDRGISIKTMWDRFKLGRDIYTGE